MIIYRKLREEDLEAGTLSQFCHEQRWDRQWVKGESTWVLESMCGCRQWNPEKRVWVSAYLKRQIQDGGSVVAAFDGQQMVGFACVEGQLKGAPVQYANLTMLFVDDRFQHRGIGKRLMEEIKKEASGRKADRLFISSIPSEDTVGFYFAVGCKDAEYIIPEFIDTEKDRPLELQL